MFFIKKRDNSKTLKDLIDIRQSLNPDKMYIVLNMKTLLRSKLWMVYSPNHTLVLLR